MYDLSNPEFAALLAERALCRETGQPIPPLPDEPYNLTGLFWGVPGMPDKQELRMAQEAAGEITRPLWLDEKRNRRSVGSEKYPFTTTPVGGSFWVDPGQHQPKWNSFRIHCHKRGKDLKKVFRCHRHPDGRYEVYREA